ncbi:FtsK/SpoIIIE domain-containing protein [Cellulomonas wangsupingiae]|uniref:FtsK/SpoIIIE domain-containing protein n=1 Tax=Cellulomonas wangsupingiae TaxID=2968085 RepID=A0ABY5K4H2_9CELL|nr:FtsK/SpoIIIE domain-containing protein [Cellulomonas wangsupingiae]UUI63955.1 FtsK/SpoIIIE domain-containing protein [Cellulomonas wangsupingiae]
MRITVPSPVAPARHVDVDVEPGLSAGALRRRLALLTGDPGWAAPHTPLRVAGTALDDAHPAGAPPLVPGAHLGPGAAPPDDAARAVLTAVHVAVLRGTDAGRLVPLPDGARVRLAVPRAPSGTARPAHGSGPQDAGPAVHVETDRRGRRVRVRVVGARGTLRARARRPGARGATVARPVGRRGRTWPAGTLLSVAGTTFVLRARGDGEPAGTRPTHRLPPWAWTAAASSVAALVLAAALRQPLLLLTAVTGLTGLLGLVAGGAGRSRGPSAADPSPAPAEDVGPARRPAAGPPGADRDPAAGTVDVAAVRLATARRLLDRAGPVAGDDGPWPVDRTLALVGPRDATLAVARALVVRAMGAGGPMRLVVRGRAGDDWRWTRWWEPSQHLPGADDGHVLVVADGLDDGLGPWRLAAGRALLLLVVPPGGTVPAWASTVVRAGDEPATRRPRAVTARRTAGDGLGSGRASLDDPPPTGADDLATGPPQAVGRDVAEAQARAAAALGWLLATRGATGPLPRSVALGLLPGVPPPDPAAVAAAWRRPSDARELRAPVGVGADGRPAVLDLVRDGPHALAAGTTGAGKSELLTTLVLALALTHPPRRLAVLLVDFKGGTGLGPVAGLPHVVDHVHDLDVTAARRTLVGLRAELHRRERLLTRAGLTDVADLDPADPATPARLLVVVDELRALVDDLPDAAATLARLGAQGRALGVHLLLATQRPGGAAPADLRANVLLRIALRVADEADSRELVGTSDAAHLDAAAPGRALVRAGARAAVPVQVARARRHPAAAPVRLVHPAGGPSDAPGWRAASAPTDDVAAWVDAARVAARGLPGTGVPWPPALPDRVLAADAGPLTAPGGLLLALADVPAEQRRAVVRWAPDEGPLLVLGGPRSGRSTTLLTVGTHAVVAGAHVHAVGLPDEALAHLHVAAPHLVGTTPSLDDPHRTLLLLDRLTSRDDRDGPADLLLVDGLDALLDALVTHARGAGVELLTALLHRPPAGVHVAAAGPVVPALARLVGAFACRVVLPVPDPSLDALAGVPPALAGPRTDPGRAIVSSRDGTHLCQVVLPATVRCTGPVTGGHPRRSGGPAGPLRIGALPVRSPRDGPPSAVGARSPLPGGIPLGAGGDGPWPVDVEQERPLVVAGPPGSGRSTTLRTLALGWAEAGRRVLLAGRASGAPGGGDTLPAPGDVVEVSWDAAARLLDGTGGTTGHGAPAGAPVVLLVDDQDQAERATPELADLVDRALTGAPGAQVVALATTCDHASGCYRGPVATALRSRHVLVLDPHGPAAADLLGPGAALQTDPRHRPAGRGVLRLDRTLLRVQVHDPGPRPLAGRGPRP